MDKIVIYGGRRLTGDISVSGMKNAADAIILSTILVEDECIIENLPDISDVNNSLDILRAMGAKVERRDRNTAIIDTTSLIPGSSPVDIVGKMRASYYLIGAELGRYSRAHVGYPGGCDFGVRPIDQHIKGFEALGADVTVQNGYINAEASGGLKGSSIYMDVVTVGGTINTMLAAVKADGITIIENAAHEPHIVDTANFLNACGAQISGAGTDVIKIRGVKKLHGVTYAIIPDMIEAGTYMILAAATGGRLKINGVIPKHMDSISAKLIEMGVSITEEDEAVIVERKGRLSRVNIKTLPYPGFPTDMNPQMCVLLCLAEGTSILTEGVFDSRFRYVEELKRMSAKIKVDGKVAIIEGTGALTAAPVRAVDLRAGVAMIIAGLAASGRTEIDEIYHIQRGYERIIEKLNAVGADIKLIHIPDSVIYEKAE
ncbi:MAG: UDP-N-acetylglucosamine 1-carboxyvinyltransferase [Oscillospiraceae bacterium]|nr:UDP-N-acetylglucosamine 1-carboxyvinyltransferase [Oscillospiraceae bacterium]